MEAIKGKMTNIQNKKIFNLIFNEGNINSKEYVVVKCGIGKVNAARTTQIMIDNYEVECIINIGSAGALNDKLNIGDIVIGDNLVQHDFDISAFGHEKGYITDTGKMFSSDKKLVDKIKELVDDLLKGKKENKFNYIIGTIASGDVFCTQIKMKEDIRNEFNAECVEMEGAAIAQVCYLNKIPFLILRSISDSPNGNNQIDFNKYLSIAAERCASIIQKM